MTRTVEIEINALEAISLKLRHLAGAAFTVGGAAWELGQGTLSGAAHAIEDSCEMIAAEIERLGEKPAPRESVTEGPSRPRFTS